MSNDVTPNLRLYKVSQLTAIADAIRAKVDTDDTYTVDEMPQAIEDIPVGVDFLEMLAQNSSSNRLTLTDDEIKSEATKIRKYTFYEAYIGRINLQNITEVGPYAFYNGRATNIVLPNCTTLGNYAFYKINNTDDNITTHDFSKVETIGTQCFYESHIAGFLDLPECRSIGENAFRSCSRITGLSLPKLTSISSQAFNFCTFTFDITLPSIVSIGNNAFNHTTSTNFTIGPNCTSIGTGIFNAGAGVTNLYVQATIPPTLSGRFKGTSGMSGVSHIYVPADSVAAYKAANNWSIYESIIEAIPTA